MLAENLIELDKLEEAAAEVDVDLGAAAHTFIEPFVLTTRGRVRFLLRRLDEAETDLRRVVAFCDARTGQRRTRCSGGSGSRRCSPRQGSRKRRWR